MTFVLGLDRLWSRFLKAAGVKLDFVLGKNSSKKSGKTSGETSGKTMVEAFAESIANANFEIYQSAGIAFAIVPFCPAPPNGKDLVSISGDIILTEYPVRPPPSTQPPGAAGVEG